MNASLQKPEVRRKKSHRHQEKSPRVDDNLVSEPRLLDTEHAKPKSPKPKYITDFVRSALKENDEASLSTPRLSGSEVTKPRSPKQPYITDIVRSALKGSDDGPKSIYVEDTEDSDSISAQFEVALANLKNDLISCERDKDRILSAFKSSTEATSGEQLISTGQKKSESQDAGSTENRERAVSPAPEKPSAPEFSAAQTVQKPVETEMTKRKMPMPEIIINNTDIYPKIDAIPVTQTTARFGWSLQDQKKPLGFQGLTTLPPYAVEGSGITQHPQPVQESFQPSYPIEKSAEPPYPVQQSIQPPYPVEKTVQKSYSIEESEPSYPVQPPYNPLFAPYPEDIAHPHPVENFVKTPYPEQRSRMPAQPLYPREHSPKLVQPPYPMEKSLEPAQTLYPTAHSPIFAQTAYPRDHSPKFVQPPYPMENSLEPAQPSYTRAHSPKYVQPHNPMEKSSESAQPLYPVPKSAQPPYPTEKSNQAPYPMEQPMSAPYPMERSVIPPYPSEQSANIPKPVQAVHPVRQQAATPIAKSVQPPYPTEAFMAPYPTEISPHQTKRLSPFPVKASELHSASSLSREQIGLRLPVERKEALKKDERKYIQDEEKELARMSQTRARNVRKSPRELVVTNFGTEPVLVQCPHCKKKTVTKVNDGSSDKSKFSRMLLSCFEPSEPPSKHTCSCCDKFLGLEGSACRWTINTKNQSTQV